MKWVSTTIKKKYFLQIKNGTKDREYKEYSEYWRKRLEPLMEYHGEIGGNFLCGREHHKRKILYIQHVNVTWTYDVDGKELSELFIIYLGEEIKGVKQ